MKSPVHPDVEMKKMILPHGDIEIEYCPVSGGVWLDKGELEKLSEVIEQKAKTKYSNAAEQDNRPFASQPDSYSNRSSNDSQDYNDDYDYKNNNKKPYKKKRESIFGEIFDIF